MADNLASYTPTAPQASLVQRFVWLFTRAGRGRRCLWLAYQAENDDHVLPGLEKCLWKLKKTRRRETSIATAVIREILLYLTWRNLRGGQLAEARKWLGDLDQHAPDQPERILLRWELLIKLVSAGQMELYLKEATLFLADKLLSTVDPGDAVLTVVATAYEKASRSACKTLIDAADQSIKNRSQLGAAFSLCVCPDDFSDCSEALSWENRVNPDCLIFSTLMQADALLVRARAEECRGAWEAMESCARRALALVPDYCTATYWLVRARLHRPEGDPIRDVDMQTASRATPEWARLRHEVDLHQHPTLEHARTGVEMLQQKQGALDSKERELLIVLLEKVLTLNPSWTPSQLATCVSLCSSVEAVVGRLAWTDLNLAFSEIRCERRYDKAIARLERNDVPQQPLAAVLARAARILAGSPHLDAVDADHETCLSAIEIAMAAIVRPGQSSAHDKIVGLQQRLYLAGDDPWCAYLPSLRTVVEGLVWLIGHISRCKTSAATPDWNPPDDSPRWLRWLHARASLLARKSLEQTSILTGIDCSDPAIAWSVENWSSLYGIFEEDALPKIEQCRQRLDELAWPATIEKTIRALRQSRAHTGQRPAMQVLSATGKQGMGDLGKVCNDLWLDELKLEVAYVKARRQFATDGSASAFAPLIQRVVSLSWLTVTWWEPVIKYWHGVALLKQESPTGVSILEGIVEGPKGLEALGQLALLAVQRGDLEAAEHLIGGAPPLVPAIIYGQALLAHRRGDDTSAYQQLQSLESATAPSPYHLAARRLSAVIAERQGQMEKAEQLYRATLAEYPADHVSLARLRRLVLKRNYAETRAGGWLSRLAADDETFPDGPLSISWSRQHAMLQQVLLCPKEQVRGVQSEVVADHRGREHADAWFQVLARRLLQVGLPREASTLLDSTDFTAAPAWNRRSRLILRAWQLLSSVWSASIDHSVNGNGDPTRQGTVDALSGVREQIADCAEKIEQLSTVGSDEGLRRWHFLIERARELSCDHGRDIVGEAWGALADWPIAVLPHLWSGSREERSRAGESLSAAVCSEDGAWNVHQRRLLTALSSWAAGRYDVFLDAYSDLENVLDELPVRGPSLWVSAASLWFQRGDWKRILDSSLPNCVADLADSQVRLLTGLAYARAAAADSLNQDFRSAVRRIEQAQSTLDEVLQPVGQQGSLALSKQQKEEKT